MSRKQLLIGLAIAVTVFSAAFGVAATLSVSTNTLQSGADATLESFQCDTNGVIPNYTVAWEGNSTHAYVVDDVIVTGITTGCDNKDFSITLLSASNGVLGTASLADQNSTGSLTFDVRSQNAKAEDVVKIHVAVSDNDGTE